MSTRDRTHVIAAVEAAAFETDEGCRVVHSMAGYLGADWDVAAVIAAIKRAQSVEFGPDIFGHHLRVVREDGRLIRFAVPLPTATVVDGAA